MFYFKLFSSRFGMHDKKFWGNDLQFNELDFLKCEKWCVRYCVEVLCNLSCNASITYTLFAPSKWWKCWFIIVARHTVEPLYKGHPRWWPFKRGGLSWGIKLTWFVKNGAWQWTKFCNFSETSLAFPEGFHCIRHHWYANYFHWTIIIILFKLRSLIL